MNLSLLANIGFVCLIFACNSNNSDQKNPVIVELPPKKTADSPKPKGAISI